MTDLTLHDAALAHTEQSRLLLAAHTAMRADARRLRHAVGRLPEAEAQSAAALAGAFSELAALVHDHHLGEDDVIYPHLIARVPGFELDAMRLEQDHVELDGVMTRIAARLRLLADSTGRRIRDDAHARLIDDAALFDEILLDHLGREEEVVVPALDTGITAADRQVMNREQSKLATYRHLRRSVPWVLANASPQEAAELRAGAPRLLRMMHDHAWKRHFLHTMAALYDPGRPDAPRVGASTTPPAPA